MIKILLIALTIVLLSGCASISGPTSDVKIINGKYAVQTTIPNSNKGKKVKITAGQSYSCEMKNPNTDDIYSFDLQVSNDGNTILTYNDKKNGKLSPTSYTGKFVWKPKYGFSETTKGDGVIRLNTKYPSKVFLYMTKKDAVANRGYMLQCTQTTNNVLTNTRYLTRDEIDMYKHNQQISVQQRAIDSANYNASMARWQAQTAQMNYDTQQMLNRKNTYNLNVYHY